MSSGNGTWICRKGRTPKEPPVRAPAAGLHSKSQPYGSSHLLTELNSIVCQFTEKQKRIPESTGFRSFSKPVHAFQFDRQFVVWLMPKVDTVARSIGVSPGKRLMNFQEDAAKVFGIPCSGKEVWDASLDKSQAMRNMIEGTIGMSDHTTSARSAAKKTLLALAGRDLSSEEEVKFKVAFAVWVVSLLCDSNNPCESESVNYWPALKDPDMIHMFNWSKYVLDSVFSACAKARMATRANSIYMPPAGTALFLQVFYLGNMDYGEISLPKSVLPRIELYDARTFSRQIMAETIGFREQTDFLKEWRLGSFLHARKWPIGYRCKKGKRKLK